jgi:hypothetical protein
MIYKNQKIDATIYGIDGEYWIFVPKGDSKIYGSLICPVEGSVTTKDLKKKVK